MKRRILKNWTFARLLYLFLGVTVIVQSVMSQQWFGLAFGGYFAAMGLFAFGCAAGNCFGGNCETRPHQQTETDTPKLGFEEVKQTS